MNALVEQVEISNQNVRLAEARFRQAQAAITGARSALFPTVDAQASIVRSRSPSGALGGTTAGRIVTNRSASLEATGRPICGAACGAASRRARPARRRAPPTSSRRGSRRRRSSRTSYFLIRVLDVQKKLLDDTVGAYEKTLELTRNRYDAGVVGAGRRRAGRNAAAEHAGAGARLGVQRAQLEHAIALLMGKAPADFTLPPAPLRITVPEIPLGVPSELLERRSDIAAAERRVAAANAQIGVAQSAFFPVPDSCRRPWARGPRTRRCGSPRRAASGR